MVTDATKKLREPVAYILLAFAGLVALASLIRLFVGSDFTSSAGIVQGTLTPPGLTALVVLAALVGAVALVTESGERTPNARTITLVALAIAGLNVLLGLVTAFADFGDDGDAGLKVVGFIYALGGLALYGAAGLYLMKTFQSLPAPARAPKPGQPGQFAGPGQDQYGQQGGQQGGHYGGQYGQQGGAQGQYGQYSGAQGQYGQPEQGQGQYGQPDQGQGQYGQYGAAAAGAGAGALGGYAAGQAEGQWPPQEQSWNQGEQQAWPAGTEAEAGSTAPTEAHDAPQEWSPESGRQWSGHESGDQQWPQQEQHQWGADSGQQQWAGQEQYGQQAAPGQPGQPEWQQGQPQQGEQGWQQQGWQQEEQSWPQGQGEAQADPAPETHTGSHAADETRVEPRAEEDPKAGEGPDQQGKGWWSQSS